MIMRLRFEILKRNLIPMNSWDGFIMFKESLTITKSLRKWRLSLLLLGWESTPKFGGLTCVLCELEGKSDIQTWEKMRSKLKNRFLNLLYLHEKVCNQARKAKQQQKAKLFKWDFFKPTITAPSFLQKQVPEPIVIPLSTPQKNLARQKNQIGSEASKEVVKEVTENKDADVVLDLSHLDGTKEETLTFDELIDEKGANETSLILSSPQVFETEQEETEYELQHGTEPCNQDLSSADQEEVVEKVEEEEILILTKTLSEFHDLGEQNESDGA